MEIVIRIGIRLVQLVVAVGFWLLWFESFGDQPEWLGYVIVIAIVIAIEVVFRLALARLASRDG